MTVFTIVLVSCVFFSNTQAESFKLISPNQKIVAMIETENYVRWNLSVNGVEVIKPSKVVMNIDGKDYPGKHFLIKEKNYLSIDETIPTIVAQKSKIVENKCNELTLSFDDNYSIQFRLYDNGFAYRFITKFDKEIKVFDEVAEINFGGDYQIYFPEESGFISHFERSYNYLNISSINSGRFCSLPALVSAFDNIKIGITESGQYDYPGMFLAGTGSNSLKAIFPKYVLQADPEEAADRNEVIVKEADYIADTKGSRNFPWRIFMISNKDTELLENQLVFILSDPLQLQDTDWIKPGKVAWDWWNALNIYGVDFKSGINTETYKYYIDFAGKLGIEYIILDEGWSKSTTNILEADPAINLQELISYGKSKNVGLILWVLWKPLDNNLEKALDKYAEWGIKGIKVDFMQRADQWMVGYYEKVSREAAKRKLLVDFHGAFKPAGLMRKYPNYLTNEGVKGLEHAKWSKDITPDHDLTLPFTRMLAGPMDFTPGAMNNANERNFNILFERPMSMGTRCHQIAMYVVFESPLQMMCDNPSNYLKEFESAEFISRIPTTWDETKALDAKVGDYILMARKKDNKWYVGAMNDWTPRELTLDLSFLDEGKYSIEFMRDGINADRFASDYKKEIKEITNRDQLKLKLAGGGGWAALISKK